MEKEYIIEKLQDYFDGEASDETSTEVRTFLAENPEYSKQLNRWSRISSVFFSERYEMSHDANGLLRQRIMDNVHAYDEKIKKIGRGSKHLKPLMWLVNTTALGILLIIPAIALFNLGIGDYLTETILNSMDDGAIDWIIFGENQEAKDILNFSIENNTGSASE